MHDTAAEHPSLALLQAFDQGRLNPSDWAAVERHVLDCPECGRRVEGLPEQTIADLVGDYRPRQGGKATPAEDRTALAEPAVAAGDIPAELVEHPRYRLLGVLGAGGMGKVFKAEHRLMGRVVALKVIHRHLLEGGTAVERFRQEVRAAAQLAHPNIVTAYDAEQAGDAHFLVMEYVEGETLDRTLERRGPLPVAEACGVVRQATRGLQHAHERGLVHRDLKPSNLLVTAAGQVKILDFGLAQLARQPADRPPLTPEGAVVGTPAYVAPEQAREPHSADVRADLYSLGCTLYFLLTGQPPFPEGTVLQQLLAHQQKTARPLSAFRGDIPPALAAVVDRLLAKDPAERLRTPAELVDALAPFAGPVGQESGAAVGQTAVAAPRSPRRRRMAVLVAAGLLAAVVAAVWYVTSHGRDEGPPPADLARPWSTRPSARDQAVAWVKANNRFGPDHVIVSDTWREINEKAAGGRAFIVRLGDGLVRSGNPTLLAGRHHDLGVFKFTRAQVGKWITPMVMDVFATEPQSQEYDPRQLVLLSDLRLDPPGMDPRQKMTGSVSYRRLGPVSGTIALRLTSQVDLETRTRYETVEPAKLAQEGVLKFALSPLMREGEPPRQPVIAFLELGFWQGEPVNSKLVVVSNTLPVALMLRDREVVLPALP